MPRKKKKVIDRPIVVGDYVKVKLSGLGADAYVVEEIHDNGNYTVVLNEVGINGHYTHRIGENGTMFVTGKPGYKKTNLKNRLVLV
tara:strand:+ start:155 stop:412 length:258 start_codon:yes stop_codon:yes gene_type:complete